MFKFPKKSKQERLSVSLSPDLAQWARDIASAHDTTISGVVSYALRQMKSADMDEEMIRNLTEDLEDAK